jgi:hypothetical protein
MSIKSKLIIVAVMFVIINLIFYVGFDSSDESEKSMEFDDKLEFNAEKIPETEQELINPISP